MFNWLKIYIRCVVVNRFTLFGYSSALIYLGYFSLLVFLDGRPTGLFLIIAAMLFLCGTAGSLLLGGTGFAIPTYVAYCRTRDHIKEFGSVDPRFQSKMHTYCEKVGFGLAVRDFSKN